MKASAWARQRSRGIFERGQCGRAQILVEHAGAAVADHIERARHRIGRDRHARGERLEHHEAECVGAARKDEHVGGGIKPRELAVLAMAEEMRGGKAALAARRAPAPRRPPPSSPADRAPRNAARFFSTATRPTQRKIGPGKADIVRRRSAGSNSVAIDAARPRAQIGEAARREIARRPIGVATMTPCDGA